MQAPGEKLVEKLWDSIADKGIGSLLKPWQMRREGKAAAEIERLNLLTKAQAEVDAEDIRSGKKVLLANGSLSKQQNMKPMVLPSNLLSLQEAVTIATHNADMEALRREISISKAVAYAESELAQDSTEPSYIPLSDDWLLRWRENAATVSSDELQSLWGKVLAGEVKSPGQFSLRVLDFLRNLSQTEAKELELLSRVMTDGVILRCDERLNGLEITPSLLASAEELGIITGTGAMGFSRNISSELNGSYQAVIRGGQRAILITNSDSTKVAVVPCYQITRLGQQVLQLAGSETDITYLHAIGAEIKKQGFEVFIGNYELLNENMYQITNLLPV